MIATVSITPPAHDPGTILAYRHDASWTTAPAPDWMTGTSDTEPGDHEAAGWLLSDELGDECSMLYVQLYERHQEDGVLAYLGTLSAGEWVLLPTLPDLVAFLQLVTPVLLALEQLDAQSKQREAERAKRKKRYADRG